MKKYVVLILSIIIVLKYSSTVFAIEGGISGPDQVLIPNAMESTANYTVDEGYEFILYNKEGTYLDENGLLIITKEAKEQEVFIEAKRKNHVIQKKVSLVYSWSKNKKFQEYQIKEKLKPIVISDFLINQQNIISMRIFLFSIFFIVILGYLLKKGGNK